MDRHWIDCKCSIKVEYISLENKGEVTIFQNMLFLTTLFNPGYGDEETDPLRKATLSLLKTKERKKKAHHHKGYEDRQSGECHSVQGLPSHRKGP